MPGCRCPTAICVTEELCGAASVQDLGDLCSDQAWQTAGQQAMFITPRHAQPWQHHFEATAGTAAAHLVHASADLGSLAQASPADLCRCLLQGTLAAATPTVTCWWVPALQASASA